MAHALEDLGVDILEAGFAMASEGDFAAIATITQAIRKPRIASLARARSEDIEWPPLARTRRPRPHPRLPRLERSASRIQAQDEPRTGPRPGRRIRPPGALALSTTSSSRPKTPPAPTATSSSRWSRRHRGRSHHHQHARHRRLLHARRVRPDVPRSPRAHSGHRRRRHHPLLALPRRSRPRRRQLAGRRQAGARQVECTINGIGERAGNAALEEIAAALYVRADRYGVTTNIKLDKLYPTSQTLGQIITFGPRPTRPSSAPTPSRTSPAFTSTACWPTRSATRS
jgi:2-isopropylmalate synthase